MSDTPPEVFEKKKKMVKINHLPSATLYNVTTMKQSYYNEFIEKGQLKIYFDLFQLRLPAGDPFYTLKHVLEELNSRISD